MKGKLLLAIGVIWVSCIRTTLPTRPIFPAINTVITRITNNTIDVLQGVSGVVQGGVHMLFSTISRIIEGAGTVRDKIIQLLEEFRKYMQKGIPELGIPILEPLTIDRIDLNIDSPKLGTIKGYAAKVEVRRLSKFRIDYVNWDPRRKLFLNITFPRIDVRGKYAGLGNISQIKIYGQGPFCGCNGNGKLENQDEGQGLLHGAVPEKVPKNFNLLKLIGLSIETISQFRYDIAHDPQFYVERMKIGIKLKTLNNNFSNFMNGTQLGELFNEVISKVAPETLDMVWADLEHGISPQVAEIINEKLKVFQLSGILGRLLNFFTIKQGRINVYT